MEEFLYCISGAVSNCLAAGAEAESDERIGRDDWNPSEAFHVLGSLLHER